MGHFGPDLSDPLRAALHADAIERDKAGEVALEVTSEIFEVLGADASTRSPGLDRFWRSARIHTLHNPAEYKTRNVGRRFVSGQPPEPGTFQ